MMRVVLYLITNFAIVAVIGVVIAILSSVFGIKLGGSSMGGMLAMCAVYGFVGSIISLFMSKGMAKRSAGVQMIEQPQSHQEQWLYDTVAELAERADIGMPEVGIFPAREMNAFATGWNKNNALVAVSQGLLDGMSKGEARAVMAHEIGHVANGDMVTLSLIQGVMNTFVFFFSMVIANALSRGENGRSMLYYPIQLGLQFVLGFLASIVVAWFSRRREFRADEAGAIYADKRSMINALKRLQQAYEPSQLPSSMSAFAISGGFKELFSTHPPLDQRIQTLEEMAL